MAKDAAKPNACLVTLGIFIGGVFCFPFVKLKSWVTFVTATVPRFIVGGARVEHMSRNRQDLPRVIVAERPGNDHDHFGLGAQRSNPRWFARATASMLPEAPSLRVAALIWLRTVWMLRACF
jgi:hypothetical protein